MRTLVLLGFFGSGPAWATSAERVTVPGDFATLQEAIDRSAAEVIEVGPGRFQGAIVDRPVRIVGRGAAIVGGPVVRGLSVGFHLRGGASGVVIEGFDFACGASDSLDGGVYASARHAGAPDGVTVRHNTFSSCVQGVTNAGRPVEDCARGRLDGGRGWAVHDNTFDGFRTVTDRGGQGGGIGVLLFNVEGADVVGNVFTGRVHDRAAFATSGVSLGGCVGCVVADNEFSVEGGRHHWSAIANLGAAGAGAAASELVLVAGNDASWDSAPRGVNFWSFDSVAVEFDGNVGAAWVDHAFCGDGELRRVD